MKSTSRWARWSPGTKRKLGLSSFLSEAQLPSEIDAGNPTGTGAVSPKERAEQMGLVSDGHGSYVDPESGQVVARTVNGELIFYDNNRASGGAIADGSGGAALTQAAPSWQDPDTGLIVVPPAQPESPEELDAVPDPTPAKEPAGYASFMQRKKEEKKRENQLIQQAESEIEEKTHELSKYPDTFQYYTELQQELEMSVNDPELQLMILNVLVSIEDAVESGNLKDIEQQIDNTKSTNNLRSLL